MKQLDRNEQTNNYLDNIEKRIYLICECYSIWHYLVREHNQRNQVIPILDYYTEFFSSIKESLFVTIITKIATLFDIDERSISFPNLINLVNQCEHSGFETSFNYNEFYERGRRIWKYRCKDVAHVDRDSLVIDFLKEANFKYEEFEEFIKDCKKLIHELFNFQNKPIPQYITDNSGIETLISDLSKLDEK